jgi:putative N6-adenine-specific DNA methylase/tRNA (guanine6-N2)-methyltransferase
MTTRASVTSLRSAERTPLLFTTNMGLEDVVIEEYRERAAAAGLSVPEADDAPLDLRSYARVEVGPPPSRPWPSPAT